MVYLNNKAKTKKQLINILNEHAIFLEEQNSDAITSLKSFKLELDLNDYK